MFKQVTYTLAGVVFGAMVFAGNTHAAATKPVAKIDCSQKKNQKKLECKEAPKSNVKPAVKKPEKVERKAPKSVQQKAAENNKK